MAQRARGVRVGGWPGSFFNKVKSIAKSKLVSQIGHAVKSVVRSKITGAAISAAAVVFPAVGIPAAAAYATANAALSALDKAEAAKREAQAILASGSLAQKAALAARAPEIRATLAKAAEVKGRLREIANRAGRGDLAARKTARIFGHVMQHRKRVRVHERNLQASIPSPGMLVTDYGNIVSGDWLLGAAAQTGLPLLHAAAQPALRAQPAPRAKHPASQLPAHRRRHR